MTRYKGWPAWGKWLDTKQNFPASSGKFLGLIQGPPLRVGGGPPELMAQRGETLGSGPWASMGNPGSLSPTSFPQEPLLSVGDPRVLGGTCYPRARPHGLG